MPKVKNSASGAGVALVSSRGPARRERAESRAARLPRPSKHPPVLGAAAHSADKGVLLPASAAWSARMCQQWHADGGVLTTANAAAEADPLRFIDSVGEGLPLSALPCFEHIPGGVLGAAARRESGVFERWAAALAREGWARVQLGIQSAEVWTAACEEASRLWVRMRPGVLTSSDGEDLHGVSPSGTPRGDRYVNLAAVAEAHSLAQLDLALASVGASLMPALRASELKLQLSSRSDPTLACFPGGGASYGAHYDGGGDPRCKLTMILYLNRGWREADGGELRLLDEGDDEGDNEGDEAGRCWRTVRPEADTLLVFRSEEVLHRVMPSFRQRFALTCWWFDDPGPAGAPVHAPGTQSTFVADEGGSVSGTGDETDESNDESNDESDDESDGESDDESEDESDDESDDQSALVLLPSRDEAGELCGSYRLLALSDSAALAERLIHLSSTSPLSVNTRDQKLNELLPTLRAELMPVSAG